MAKDNNRMDTVLTEMAGRMDELERRLVAGRVQEMGPVMTEARLAESTRGPRVFVLPDGMRVALDRIEAYQAAGERHITLWVGGTKIDWAATGASVPPEAQQLRDAVMASLDRVLGTTKTQI